MVSILAIERARYWLPKTYLTLLFNLLCGPHDMQMRGGTWGAPPCTSAGIYGFPIFKEGGLVEKNAQASNSFGRFGKEGVYDFSFIKGKCRHVFSARG